MMKKKYLLKKLYIQNKNDLLIKFLFLNTKNYKIINRKIFFIKLIISRLK